MQERLDNLLKDFTVLAIYRCGSRIYGLEQEDSDLDYTVIIEEGGQPLILKDEGLDLFVYPKSYFKKLVTFDMGIISYFAVWVDNVLLAKENLEFLDESYKEEFESLINIDWDKYFYRWLAHVVEYFYLRVRFPETKCLYTLYRIRSEVKHYLETKKFEPYFDESDFAKSKELKANNSLEKHLPELQEIFSYLELALKEKKQ